MIRADELTIPAAPAAPMPYYRRRLAELVEAGLARRREAPKRLCRRESWRRKAARIFGLAMRKMGTAGAYWLPGERRVAYRKTGAAFRVALPADAQLIGTYTGAACAERFLDDLVATMKGAK